MNLCVTRSRTLVLCVFFNLIGFSRLQTADKQNVSSNYICPKRTVEILISPLVSPNSIHPIEIAWTTSVDIMPGDYVALYQEDPSNPDAQPLFSMPVDAKEGWVTTHVHQNKTYFKPLAFFTQCLGFWIAYKNNVTKSVLASSCFKTEPRWMEKYRGDLENLRLKDLFVPGTHNSGSFLLTESYLPFYETMLHKYVYTQDESILSQLIFGARYLDLRVAHYPDTEEVWWLNHDFFRIRPLKFILDDIILFVNMTKEIVIIDFHEFPVGFKLKPAETHSALLDYLISYLGDKLVPILPEGWSSTLGAVWNTNRQIILSYNKIIYGENNEIWSPVNQKWGNVQNLEDLKKYMDETFRKYSEKELTKYPWAAMVELTPLLLDIVTDRLGGLRKMALSVNRNVTRWFQGDYGKYCNIVAVDFLKSTGIIQAAIDWNRRKALQINCRERERFLREVI